jgi:uncharacterized cupredoxin-like copper-binding protein
MRISYIFICFITALILLTACSGSDLPPQKIAIHGLDIKFDVNTLTVQAGRVVELTYENKGMIDHAFEIGGLVDEVRIRPGQKHIFKFTVNNPGSYQYVCAMPGHEMAGMVGMLIAEP